MNTNIMLCVDSESRQNPQLVGLEGENLEAQQWLRVFCSAVEARKHLKSRAPEQEIWVASSDEVDPINLAAALKKDAREQKVYLLAFHGTGSLKSRAKAAHIDGTFTQEDFLRRYAYHKQSHLESAYQNQHKHESSNGNQMFTQTAFEQELQVKPQVTSTVSRAEIQKITAPSLAIPGKSAQIVSVVSASGGTGKSTIAALSALFAQGLGCRTLLLDADLQFGDMRHFLGIENPLTVDAVIEDPAKLSYLRAEGLMPALLAAPLRLEQSEVLIKQLPSLLEQLRSLFDVIIVNTGAFWTEQHAALIERSSTVLFLLDQRPSSLHASKHALDLCTRCGIAVHPFLFALNRCTRNAALTSLDVSCALKGSRAIELQEGGREVEELLNAGVPLELINAKNPLCLSIERMLLDILPQLKSLTNSADPTRKAGKRFAVGRKRRKVACL